MSLRHAKQTLAIGATLLLLASGRGRSCAQEAAMPDSSYGDSADNYQSPTDLPLPASGEPANPDSVTIPIPGGGEITVDGPDAPDDTKLPTLPGSQWGEQQLTPNSHDVGAIGP